MYVAGTTGQYSVYTKFRDNEIMFHVSTLLPYQPHNRQQVSILLFLIKVIISIYL